MKKMISILLCVIFCFACFAPAAFAADKKTIKVATNVAFPPYEYYEDEKAVGIDVDIMQAICDKLGYEMELSDMEFGSIITAVASGKIDVGFGAITITEERAKSVHFTTSYSTGIQSIILRHRRLRRGSHRPLQQGRRRRAGPADRQVRRRHHRQQPG